MPILCKDIPKVRALAGTTKLGNLTLLIRRKGGMFEEIACPLYQVTINTVVYYYIIVRELGYEYVIVNVDINVIRDDGTFDAVGINKSATLVRDSMTVLERSYYDFFNVELQDVPEVLFRSGSQRYLLTDIVAMTVFNALP